MAEEHPLNKLKPGTEVYIAVCRHVDLCNVGDIRKTLVKQVSGDSILLCQPGKPLLRDAIGKVLNISWLDRLANGTTMRRMMDAELLDIQDYQLGRRTNTVLLFGRPAKVFYGTLRREVRVAVPETVEVRVDVTLKAGPMGGATRTCPLVDLSTLGLRFAWPLASTDGSIREPELEPGEAVGLNLFIDGQWVFNVEAIVRTKFIPTSKDPGAIEYGVEFSKITVTDFVTDEESLKEYTPEDGQVLVPFIRRFQEAPPI